MPTRARSVPVAEVLLFAGIATGLSALAVVSSEVAAWLGVSVNHVAMCTPAAAALIILLVRRPSSITRATACVPVGFRGVSFSLVAVFLPIALGAVTFVLAATLGLVVPDLQHFSGLRKAIGVPSGDGFPAVQRFIGWLGTQFLGMLAILGYAFGEEFGWRGYLLPKLLPLGVWPALFLSGVIWAVWHAPLLSGVDPVIGLVFLVALPFQAVLFGWIRLVSCSVWPAVVLHAANNSLNMLTFTTLASAGAELDFAFYAGGTGGLVGALVLALCAGLLAAFGQIRVRAGDPGLTSISDDRHFSDERN